VETNFAYTSGGKKLFPLCYINEDGSVNKAETCRLIEDATRTFGTKSANIPSNEIGNVISQIIGAAQSHGLTLPL
jgi:hypothetical protein